MPCAVVLRVFGTAVAELAYAIACESPRGELLPRSHGPRHERAQKPALAVGRLDALNHLADGVAPWGALAMRWPNLDVALHVRIDEVASVESAYLRYGALPEEDVLAARALPAVGSNGLPTHPLCGLE